MGEEIINGVDQESVTTFVALTDTPSSITANEYVKGNAGGTALVFGTPAGGGDVTAAAALTDNAIVRGDGGSKGVQTSGITIDDTDNLSMNSGAISSVGNVDGRDVSTDGSKLDGIEALADVTDATNVAAAGAVMVDGSAAVTGNLCFFDIGGEYISGDGTDLTITSGAKINLTAVSDVIVPVNVGIILGDGAEKLESDNTDLTINSGGAINLTATTDVVIPANVGVTFGTGEKIEGDNTDLTVTSGGAINLTATTDVVVPANVGVTFGTGEKIEGDNTDLTITSGADINLTATADINVPANIGMTFGNDGEKIEGDGTDLTIASSNLLNLTATTDVVVPVNVGIIFGDGAEKIESDNTDLTINSGVDINLTATSDINVPANVGMTFGDDGEKIEGDGTDLTIASSNLLNLTATTDVVIPVNVGLIFGDGGEKIESDNTDFTVTSGGGIRLAGSYHGTRYVELTCFEYTTDVATGDGKAYFHVPPGLNGMNLVYVHGEHITAGTGTGTDVSTFQVNNVTQAADMLSVALTIDEDETGSDTAATAYTIDTNNDDVATNDVIRIDCDGVTPTTAPKGLVITLGFQLP